MDKETFAIIEVGSTNTKTHIYNNKEIIYENSSNIKFKEHYCQNNKINENDLNLLFLEIDYALKYTTNVYLFGCSIFRNLSYKELDEVNKIIYQKFKIKLQVISQQEEANLTAYGCYSNLDYDKPFCIFIGGGGSIELVFVKDKKIIDRKFYNFGVVDITKKFSTLKNDIPDCSFDEVLKYLESLIDDIPLKTDLLVLCGGDHIFWYNSANYKLLENTLYKAKNQPFMLTSKMNDEYDLNCYLTSLNKIRQNSKIPNWFDESRSMKAITNFIAHKVDAKYIIPTKINMEDGLLEKIIRDSNSKKNK